VVSVGGTISDSERTQLIQDCFKYIDFKGKVRMDQTRKGVRAGKGPRAENQFWWLEDVGNPPHTANAKDLVPHRRWFAREIALGQRHLLDKYDLKKREYLCSTSMTAELSFLVANFAHCRPGTLVLDPFCGSASLLISAAHFGSYTLGGDIDIRVIRGKEQDKAMPAHCRFARTLKDVQIGPLSNFKQYGLTPPLDLVRCDNAAPVWKVAGVLDAIICDPPYGVRAGARKTGAREDKVAKPIPEEHRATHIPGTVWPPPARYRACLRVARSRARCAMPLTASRTQCDAASVCRGAVQVPAREQRERDSRI
jgi:tRNA (guanine10-N2)-methyltransferase